MSRIGLRERVKSVMSIAPQVNRPDQGESTLRGGPGSVTILDHDPVRCPLFQGFPVGFGRRNQPRPRPGRVWRPGLERLAARPASPPGHITLDGTARRGVSGGPARPSHGPPDGAGSSPLRIRVGRTIASMELHPLAAMAEPGLDGARAAAITMESGGGTGMFYWLHLLERGSGTPSVVASAFLGDRVEHRHPRLRWGHGRGPPGDPGADRRATAVRPSK